MSDKVEAMDNTEAASSTTADVVQHASETAHSTMDAADTDTNERPISQPETAPFSRGVLDMVTSQLTSGAYDTLNTSWPALNIQQQNEFVSSSVRLVVCTSIQSSKINLK